MVIRINDYTLAYDDQGEGIPVLFVHGYPLNRQMWRPQLQDLSQVARVLALDLRGHGESAAIQGVYEMESLAEDCAKFLDALGIQRPIILAGLSMGGYVAFAFYRRYAERLAGLILAATRAGADSLEVKTSRDQAAEQVKRGGVEEIVKGMLPKLLAPKTYQARPELVEQVKKIMLQTAEPGILGDLAGMKVRPDSTEVLPQITVPVLILHGADDQVFSQQEALAMHAAISNSKLEILPDAGHLLNLEQPEKFNRAVRRFISTIS